MAALCKPLHPDGVAIVRETLKHYGLMPAELEASAAAAEVVPAQQA
jgi:hypothetical protein